MLVIISWLSDLKFGSPPPNKEQTPCLGDPPQLVFLSPGTWWSLQSIFRINELKRRTEDPQRPRRHQGSSRVKGNGEAGLDVWGEKE